MTPMLGMVSLKAWIHSEWAGLSSSGAVVDPIKTSTFSADEQASSSLVSEACSGDFTW